ncbi:cyclin-dependent kinase inhibitor 2D-like protein [Reticulomyxa filosa]|uniref:Cyclin-dependent kinase inhibitor 2D-like protein n=1 Tax=Reticulomyxa filosa TaxID=46433 RepID=X6LKU0_RETFI|nr:cyclin-dependent kinase inhibitor 2D-like protein [Reticulomyxa filosa]|eukprot:ETO01752.1 cyclin-dependent kinase inhibitor 2D-like protein [Reticulomyxa filosa]
MATESNLPRSGSLTGEQWIQKDNLDWTTVQNNPNTSSHELFLDALYHGKWSDAAEYLRCDKSLIQVCDEKKQNILFYWANGVKQSQNAEDATKWLEEHMPPELIKKMINKVDEKGETLFHAVAAIGQYQVMQWIVDTFPELDVNQTNHCGCTALHKAARNGQLEAILWLLEHRANISIITVDGNRPEHETLKHKHIEVISYLQPPIYWPDHLDLDIQISLQAKYDRAQDIRLSFSKAQQFAKKR